MRRINVVPPCLALSLHTGPTKEAELPDIVAQTANGCVERRRRPYVHGRTRGFIRRVVQQFHALEGKVVVEEEVVLLLEEQRQTRELALQEGEDR